LNDFAGAAEQELSAGRESGIELVDDPGRLAFESLTLRSPRDGRALTNALSFEVAPNIRLLVRGTNDTAKVALVRATAGLWLSGSGRIVRPGRNDLQFLPERPYLPPGTLREVVVRAGCEHEVPDAQLETLLSGLGLDKVLLRVGGLDVERDWDHLLSLDEQQLLACARLLLMAPRFAFLDRVGTALNPDQVELVLGKMTERAITCIAVGNHTEQDRMFDAVLELEEGGQWAWRRLHDQPA
jgi:putative ATP-binding cassette transporter